jgi:hypothetical protein
VISDKIQETIDLGGKLKVEWRDDLPWRDQSEVR